MGDAASSLTPDLPVPRVLGPWESRGEQHIARLLEDLGEDIMRPGLERTPHRVWASLLSLTDGYGRDV